MPITRDVVTQVELAEAADAAAIATSLSISNGSPVASASSFGGGQLVITGRDFYINRAVGAALVTPVTSADFVELEQRCREVGVSAEVEVCPWSDQSLLTIAGDRGYRPTWFRTVLVQHSLGQGARAPSRPEIDIRPVADDHSFEDWHSVTVAGFALTDERSADVARRWGEALRRLPNRELLIARISGVPVGVASLVASAGVALLGGMTTRPEARNQGVQQALVSFRLDRALEIGCTVAASAADPGSTSERNLQRRGFLIAGSKIGMTLPPAPDAGERP